MVENTEIAASATTPAETKKAKKSSVVKKPKTTPVHPPTSQMVDAAIKDLKERSGSSLQAIKKYLAANYKVDADKLAPFIRKYLKSSVVSGKLVQTKGKGASGSFKLPANASKPKKEGAEKKSKVAKKASGEKKPKKSPLKKVVKKKEIVPAKKVISVEKKKVAKTTAKVAKKTGIVKSGSKQKSTKPSKSDAKKPKAPKPKKTSPQKKTAGKKAVKK